MSVLKPFNAIRPAPEKAKDVAALPYDVMSSEEAKQMVKGNPYSFLHVDKAEIDLPDGTYLYDRCVYEKAKENMEKLISDKVCVQDEKPCLYIYRQEMNGRIQTGIVGCASVDDYINNVIKKHEKTRSDKEQDRVNHVDTCDANTGPIFLTYRPDGEVHAVISDWCASHEAVYDFISDNVKQTIWVVDNENTIKKLSSLFDKIPNLYIADGHHRCASAVRVAKMRREKNPDFSGNEEFNFFLAVFFPSDELAIMDYNRLIKDLNGLSKDAFICKIKEKFTVELAGENAYHPSQPHSFGMYLNKKWFKLCAKEGTFNPHDPIESLDVSILQNNLIAPILGITDPKTDQRIDFVGGIRGLKELERRVDDGMAIAFSMYPTSLDELMNIADTGETMPPKSTWFEPKLLSGLFIHKLS